VAVASVLLLGDRLPGRGWAGLAIAIIGVACVLLPAIERTGASAVPVVPVLAGLFAIIAMTGGTLIQRGQIAGDPILMSGAAQNLGGALVAIAATLIVGDWRWDNDPMLWIGLAWSVLGLSAAGLSLLVWLVRHQAELSAPPSAPPSWTPGVPSAPPSAGPSVSDWLMSSPLHVGALGPVVRRRSTPWLRV